MRKCLFTIKLKLISIDWGQTSLSVYEVMSLPS